MIKQRSDNSDTYKEYQERSVFTQKHFRKKNAAAIDAYEESDKYISEHIKAYYVDGKAPKRSELAALSKELKDKRKAIMPEHKAYLLKHETAMRYTRQVRQYLNEQYMKREREKSRLGRSTKDLLNIIDTLTDKGVTLISHKENRLSYARQDTDTPAGKFMSMNLFIQPCSLPSHSWSVMQLV